MPARRAEPRHRHGQALGRAPNAEAGLLAGSATALSSRHPGGPRPAGAELGAGPVPRSLTSGPVAKFK